MCKDCGCESAHHHHHEHSHDHEHEHEHEHDHGHATHTVNLEQAVLAENDRAAAFNRGFFAARGVCALNLISSPGSGKTLLLEKTLAYLQAAKIPAAVIAADQYGTLDADRLANLGAKITALETGSACHLSAAQLQGVLTDAVPEGTRILFIENVGNLVCPVAFDLGETAKIALLSTPEGADKPTKYPALFAAARLLLLTKTDLAPVLDFDRAGCLAAVRGVHPELPVMEVSAKTGAGMEPWYAFLCKFAANAKW